MRDFKTRDNGHRNNEVTFSDIEKGDEQRAWNTNSKHKRENDRIWKDLLQLRLLQKFHTMDLNKCRCTTYTTV